MSTNGDQREAKRVAEYAAVRSVRRSGGGGCAIGIISVFVIWIVLYWVVIGLIKLAALLALLLAQGVPT
jgi:hypothetical protein